MGRTITIHLDNVEEYMLPAIQRYILWAYDGYSTVDIFKDGKKDLVARFSNKENERSFVMGAIWREDSQSWSFHS